MRIIRPLCWFLWSDTVKFYHSDWDETVKHVPPWRWMKHVTLPLPNQPSLVSHSDLHNTLLMYLTFLSMHAIFIFSTVLEGQSVYDFFLEWKFDLHQESLIIMMGSRLQFLNCPNKNLCYFQIESLLSKQWHYPSIHPFILFFHLSEVGLRGQQPKQGSSGSFPIKKVTFCVPRASCCRRSAATWCTLHLSSLAPPAAVGPMGGEIPCCGLCFVGPHGYRPSHQVLTIVHRPQAWLQDWAPVTRIQARDSQVYLL